MKQFFLESLKGKLHFWCFVEKDALFPKQALEKLVLLEKQFDSIKNMSFKE
jgi:hypothetical protein